MRQFFIMIRQPTSIQPFHRVTSDGMEPLSPGGKQTLICHVLRQGMFEHIHRFLASSTFIEKFQPLKVYEQGCQWRGLVPERLQQPWRKCPPEDRGSLQQALVCLR